MNGTAPPATSSSGNMLTDIQDAFGHLLLDYYNGEENFEIVERDDGYILTDKRGTGVYFLDNSDWEDHQKKGIEYAAGHVLDIGCGAGRHSLYLQKQGYKVVGTDISPLAIQLCQHRGLKNSKVVPITQLNAKLGVFNTILMMGHNFGLVGNLKRAKWLLKRFATMTTTDGTIIAETFNPYQTDNSGHLNYHQFNRNRGRMDGQLRLRIRYKNYSTPWFDYLQVSKSEMEDILVGTGWIIERFIDSNRATYITILRKQVIK